MQLVVGWERNSPKNSQLSIQRSIDYASGKTFRWGSARIVRFSLVPASKCYKVRFLHNLIYKTECFQGMKGTSQDRVIQIELVPRARDPLPMFILLLFIKIVVVFLVTTAKLHFCIKDAGGRLSESQYVDVLFMDVKSNFFLTIVYIS